MKLEKFKLLFEKLDSDKDGLISYDKIKLTGINNDILTLISPILKELYENKVKIDYKIFCNKVESLLANQNISNIFDS
jgi:Ca2+-binding EF-hand superfamily protein